MEIRIDTNKDSNEDIKKAIRMLRTYLGENASGYDNQKSESENTDSQFSDSSPGMLNLFGANEPQTYDNSDKDKDDDEPRIQIIEY